MSMFHDEFDQAPGLRYLNHAAIAPWPRRASEAVARFARENVNLGASDYPAWLATERRLRERLARLLNAPSRGDIALVKNTSEALSLAPRFTFSRAKRATASLALRGQGAMAAWFR